MPAPLVSVVTPTWQRHDVLMRRALRSVGDQLYRPVEYVVVSDGPDAWLRGQLGVPVVFDELPDHDPAVRWGLRARLRGLELARGDYVAYLDDDDAWRPEHLQLVLREMERDRADVAWGSALVHFPDGTEATLGGAPAWGRVQTSMIVHRRELLESATWQDVDLPDWTLVEQWLLDGARHTWVDRVTVDYWRSRMPERAIPVTTT